MNSYINLNNKTSNAYSSSKAKRTAYNAVDVFALVICAFLNFFSGVASALKNDAVRLVVRAACAIVCLVFIIGTVGACENSAITFASALIRIVAACGISFLVFTIFSEQRS